MKKTTNPVHPENGSPTGKGHGTGALGPSDRSDTGSDVMGGPGLSEDDVAIGLDRGTTSDPDRRAGAGTDLGDANLDSDSDSVGTGERATVGRDSPWREGADIAPDRIQSTPDGSDLEDEDDLPEPPEPRR